jgi:hypothetical protein
MRLAPRSCLRYYVMVSLLVHQARCLRIVSGLFPELLENEDRTTEVSHLTVHLLSTGRFGDRNAINETNHGTIDRSCQSLCGP